MLAACINILFTKTDDIYSIFILVYFLCDEQRIKETLWICLGMSTPGFLH